MISNILIKKMKATKNKELIKSKDNKKMKTYLKYSFTEFSNDNKNLKGNTLSKNETTKHIKNIYLIIIQEQFLK